MISDSFTAPVTGGDLQLYAWGDGPNTVLAAHGITASAYSWPGIAAALPDSWRLVAPDLRGRGYSRDLPGPSAMVRHAADICTAAEGLDAGGELVLAGHSMGAYVAVLAARARPDLFRRLVLIDGGIPLPMPKDADPDEVLALTLGPALERLRETYADADAYVRHDVLETEAGVRSRCREELIRQDGRDLLLSADEVDSALRGLTLPTHLLTAPLGMLGQAPGLLPAEAVQAYAEQVDVLTTEEVPEVNHYTIAFQPAAAKRVAAAITAS
jgi:lipase